MINKIFTTILISVLGVILFYTCITKDLHPRSNKPTEDSTKFPVGKNALSTIPGNNYFLTTTGGFDLFVKDNIVMPFNVVSGKCDTTSGMFVISMKSASDSLSFVNVFFKNMPVSSDTFALAPYRNAPLDENSAWATITTAHDGKTWGAIQGKLFVEITSGVVNARFDTAKAQNLANISDTTYKKMSARVFCK